MFGAWLYIIRCADQSYYTGTTRDSLEIRIAQHNAGTHDGWTVMRRPVTLVYSQYFERITDAITAERQVKNWSRAKKEALIRGDYERLRVLAKRGGGLGPAWFETAAAQPPQDEE